MSSLFSSLYWPYLVADYYRGLELVTAIVAVLIMLSSIDDLFIDLWYWTRELYRKLFIKPLFSPLTEAQLLEKPEQPLAIMVPAWLEYDVIASMLETMVSTLNYKNYMIFAGTYQNDARTIEEVERMRRRYRQLIRVEVPHDGPTCKADCLNWIVQAIFAQNAKQPEPFAGVILHDSEDVLHPLEMKYFNYLLPRIDFIQLPVTSLEREWYELVAGTYMDEFAEWHTKDLVVRESLSRMVPSAGVGTCFSRKALEELAAETHNQPFNTDTLTEDYDIGARLAQRGMKQIFGKFPVQYVTRRRPWFGLGHERVGSVRMPMAVREYFPDTFRTAYRQKARWTLGIGLQGWQQVGWTGSLANRYLLFRDRKGLFTSFIAIIAYVLLAQFLIFIGLNKLGWWTTLYPSLFRPGSWYTALLWANGFLLAARLGQRALFVGRYYGWEHALLSAPRMVIGNFINAMAAARAWKLFLGHLLFGKRLVWDKTMHDFPSTEQLTQQRQRLGDLLLSWRAIDQHTLARALEKQKKEKKPLGQILTEEGWLDRPTLEEAISFQQSASGEAEGKS
ncbi:glycosyl transferase family protein [Bordetella pseudohinzii]|uniref:Bacteriophage N4 adsorption protein B n=1 Tax=Bordetella pseudohinzii TaxID=1331258 RepID=A0A0J6F3P3_9BORD|nr:glycosyl transferase family protein [Bordetella pseudohinzii]ANY15595.1 type II secretion system protein E [Bordetella pseudohinzii]KMM27085.1 bacteriophage N4 adsorption protein B [Bordetella pseudohinzii]KXA82315.1 type II secretion system protein E [Bordetella pseudohinzii]KXA82721.1 type II secretion system protein E [Bordetella pseudohinzii]CUI56484.1 bacteriophage N4 adsorption protein B [Bordetella pseudohinzii]